MIDRTLPAELVRRAEVRVLRVVPELFLAPHAGAVVARAAGPHRTVALFEDEMTRGKLPLGLDLSGMPVYADMRFVDGRSGGHVSISGISGVATKTSYALFLLYQLLETEGGMDLLGGRANRENVRALVFNTKGEDLLHLDRPNRRVRRQAPAARAMAGAGGSGTRPVPFGAAVRAARRRRGGQPDPVGAGRAPPATSTPTAGRRSSSSAINCCNSASPPRTNAPPRWASSSRQVRIQLLRRLRRPAGDDSGAVVIADQVAPNTGYNPDRLADREPDETPIGAGHLIREFGDLIDLLEEIAAEDSEPRLNEWFGRTQGGTRQAFLRRLLRLRRHLGPLIGCGLAPLSLDNARLHVVDISRLHDDAQRFVVGALLDRIWGEKQGSGRLPLRFVVLDELNKYAPAQGFSPLKELLIDIAERGRSLGVLLIGGTAGGLRGGAGAAAQCGAESGRPAGRQRVGRLPLPYPVAARARNPLHAGHHGGVAADRAGADPDPVSVPAVRHQPRRSRAGHRRTAAADAPNRAQSRGARRAAVRAVKLLHTADWHLGARLGRHDRLPDQVAAIRAVLAVARAERPDLIVHAGDLFRRLAPGVRGAGSGRPGARESGQDRAHRHGVRQP